MSAPVRLGPCPALAENQNRGVHRILASLDETPAQCCFYWVYIQHQETSQFYLFTSNFLVEDFEAPSENLYFLLFVPLAWLRTGRSALRSFKVIGRASWFGFHIRTRYVWWKSFVFCIVSFIRSSLRAFFFCFVVVCLIGYASLDALSDCAMLGLVSLWRFCFLTLICKRILRCRPFCRSGQMHSSLSIIWR